MPYPSHGVLGTASLCHSHVNFHSIFPTHRLTFRARFSKPVESLNPIPVCACLGMCLLCISPLFALFAAMYRV